MLKTDSNLSNQLTFSIIIPALNEEKFLPLLLQDFTEQTFKQFEIVVVDGKSQDQTVAKAESFNKSLKIKILTAAKKGVSHQRNLGIKQATGKWIIFMDADNRIKPYFLQGLNYQLEKSPEIDFFTCLMAVDTYPLKHRPIIKSLNLTIEILALFANGTSGVMGAMIGVKNSVCQKFKFNENVHYGEDFDFVQNISRQGYQFGCFKDPTYYTSLRRLEKDGLIQVTSAAIQGMVQKYVLKKEAIKLKKYPMTGGGYYQEKNLTWFRKLDKLFKQASKKQIEKIKELLEKQNIKLE